jgi:hypothetical protein
MDVNFTELVNFVPASKLTKMQKIVQISTPSHNGLYDITRQVEAIVNDSGTRSGMVNVYAQGATAAIMMLFIFKYPR